MTSSASLPRATKARLLGRQLITRRDGRTVLFDSFGGQYTDNPRAVHEELLRRSAGLRHAWVAAGDVAVEGAERVAPASPQHAAAAGRMRFLVANQRASHVHVPKGVTYLQTWHGTPLKRIGLDNPRYRQDREGMRRAVRDYARWDFLVSQNPFSTEVFRRAFRYDGEVLETGYPRNDVLSRPEGELLRQRARAALQVPDERLLVLYAPTFRDDETDAPASGPALDLARIGDALGDRVHVVTRLHHRVRAGLATERGPRWSDASHWPDIRDLYCAADVLVTDYSSAMFDFAVTGRPLLFFTYDLERYRDDLRGFYFDLAEEAPGPLCRTTDEVVEHLRELPLVQRVHADAYGRFRETYCALDDGGASARVVDRVFGAALSR